VASTVPTAGASAGAGVSVDVGDWVPVTWRAGAREALGPVAERQALGLRELLECAPWITAVEVASPPALSGLYRVLYALTGRVSGLDEARRGARDWAARQDDLLADGSFPAEAIEAYFARYADRFPLVDPHGRPFLQDPRLAAQCKDTAGVNKLITGRPAGNNHSWFSGHHQDATPRTATFQQALLDVIVWCYYGAPGRCSTRTVGTLSKADTKAGPLRATLSYHPLGETLFQTLVAGLPQPEATVRREEDLCPWEWPELPDPLAAPPEATGPCSLLTARMQHALLLVPDEVGTGVGDAYITWAYREAVPVRGTGHDPYLIWQLSQQQVRYARRADAGRALWRDLDALVGTATSDSAQPQRPAVLTDLPDAGGPLRVQALGFEQESGQAREIQFVSAVTPPSLDVRALASVALAPRVGDLRRAGELMGRRLARATRLAWQEYTRAKKAADCAWAEDAAARYWPLVEQEFWQRLAEQDFDGIQRAFRRHAERAYDDVTRSAATTQHGARAWALNRFELYGGRPRRHAAPRQGNREQGETLMGSTSQQGAAPVQGVERRPAADPNLQTARRFVSAITARCQDHPGDRAALRLGLRKAWVEIPSSVERALMRAGVDMAALSREEQAAHCAVAAMIASVPRSTIRASSAGSGTNAAAESAAPDSEQAGPTRSARSGRVGGRSLGGALADAVSLGLMREGSAEAHLALLLKQSPGGLHRHLPGVVAQLAALPNGVDWARLLTDLQKWAWRRDSVTRTWGQDFYHTRYRDEYTTAEHDDDQALRPSPDQR